jgi:hypothetical protein
MGFFSFLRLKISSKSRQARLPGALFLLKDLTDNCRELFK